MPLTYTARPNFGGQDVLGTSRAGHKGNRADLGRGYRDVSINTEILRCCMSAFKRQSQGWGSCWHH